jgi:hypothetical protein
MRLRFGLKRMLGLVLGAALVLAVYVSYLHTVPWDTAGGMIGWSQAAIESRLGRPAQVVEKDVPDPHAQRIRPRPAGGVYRTLVFKTFDGTFVAWLKAENDEYVCLGSSWIEKGLYY